MEGVHRVVVDNAGLYGLNYLCSPKWTSVAEKREVPNGLGCSLYQVSMI